MTARTDMCLAPLHGSALQDFRRPTAAQHHRMRTQLPESSTTGADGVIGCFKLLRYKQEQYAGKFKPTAFAHRPHRQAILPCSASYTTVKGQPAAHHSHLLHEAGHQQCPKTATLIPNELVPTQEPCIECLSGPFPARLFARIEYTEPADEAPPTRLPPAHGTCRSC